MSQFFDWTPQWCERVTELWAAGLSGSQIALQLGHGLTRQAICGKVRRLNLPYRLERTNSAAHAWHRDQKLALVCVETDMPKDQTPLPDSPFLLNGKPVTIATVRDHMCRFPLGHGREMFLCGHPVTEHGPYCAAHKAIAFAPVKPRQPQVRLRADGKPWD